MVQTFFLGGVIPLEKWISKSQLLAHPAIGGHNDHRPIDPNAGVAVLNRNRTQDFNHLEELVSSNFQGEVVFSVAKERYRNRNLGSLG